MLQNVVFLHPVMLYLAFLSAVLLGIYDTFRKQSLKDNAVLPVLFLNTFFLSLMFLPFILISRLSPQSLEGSIFFVPQAGWEVHRYILLKSCIVLSSWIFGYFATKHLPLTIIGPINATRPVMVLIGALLLFGERLNLYQWIGVTLAILSFFLLSRSGKKEGIDFKHNRWIFLMVMAAVMGAVSGLYDKYLMKQFPPMLVQSWYNVYQVFIMCPIILLLWYPQRKKNTPFQWKWTIPCISLFLGAADFAYFYALSYPDAMISVISMIRRGSVVVSFACGALIFHEKNLRSKVVDLILVLIGMFFLYLGSK
ncbi:MAG: EamA family transporter [Bacteroidaceae bacterium]|nr:EamA family transporter [Bacteroidaceae bacterium]